MKKARGLIALVTFFTVAFCSITMAFATTVSPTPTLKVYSAVAKSEKAFYNAEKLLLGFYPVLTDMPDAFNTKIYNDVWKNYNSHIKAGRNVERDRDTPHVIESGRRERNTYRLSYEIIEEKEATRFATLKITCDYAPSRDNNAITSTTVYTYYIDKETNKEIESKADFEKAIAEFLATPAPTNG